MLSSVFAPTDGGFSETTFFPWDNESQENPFGVLSFSGSDDSTPKTNSSNSGSDDGCPVVVDLMDERKRRRMISNRESARRSRMRKQKHLENLRNLVNRHKSGNRELMNRLRFAVHHGQALGQENERLRSESVMLRQKLWDLHLVLRVWQLPNELLSSAWPCNDSNETSSKNKSNRH
ncbi:putative transcription factor bZIP family [Helianthus anomalus]